MLLLAPLASAADLTVGGIVQPTVAVDIPGSTANRVVESTEDRLELHTWMRAWANGDFSSGDRWFLEARLQHHLLSGGPEQVRSDLADVEGWWETSLGESGWDGKIAGPVRLRAGVLTERWGRLDLLPVNDVLNPREGRSGLLVPSEWQRIPIPMAVLSVNSERLRAETVLVPFSTADRLWLRDQDWSYVRQGMTNDLVAEMQGWPDQNGQTLDPETLNTLAQLQENVDELPVSLRRGLDAAVNTKNLPEALFGNGEIAERLELRARNLDLAVMVGYLRSRQPVSVLDPTIAQILRDEAIPVPTSTQVLQKLEGLPLEVTWPRTVVAGLDGSVLAGPIQIRGDALFSSDRVVRLYYADATTRPSLAAGLGLDYTRGSSVAITLESRWQHLFDAPEQMVFSRPDQVQIAGGLRLLFVAERLTVQLGGAFDLTYSEALALPRLGWRFSDHVQADLGAVILDGFETAPPRDLPEALVYEGGPLSYWALNDAVTVTLTLIR